MSDHKTANNSNVEKSESTADADQSAALSDQGKLAMQGDDSGSPMPANPMGESSDTLPSNDSLRRYYEAEVEKWAQQAADYDKRGMHDLAKQARDNMQRDSAGLAELTKEDMKEQGLQ